MKDRKLKIDFNQQPMTAIECLQIGLLLFKWAGLIKWSWWIVLIPVWISLAVIIVTLIVLKLKRYL